MDEADGAVDVLRCFRVEGNERGARRGKVRDDPVYRLNHEVHVNWHRHAVLFEGLAYERADSEVRDVMVVHYVEVDDLSAGFDYGINLLTQPSKVG